MKRLLIITSLALLLPAAGLCWTVTDAMRAVVAAKNGGEAPSEGQYVYSADAGGDNYTESASQNSDAAIWGSVLAITSGKSVQSVSYKIADIQEETTIVVGIFYDNSGTWTYYECITDNSPPTGDTWSDDLTLTTPLDPDVTGTSGNVLVMISPLNSSVAARYHTGGTAGYWSTAGSTAWCPAATVGSVDTGYEYPVRGYEQ